MSGESEQTADFAAASDDVRSLPGAANVLALLPGILALQQAQRVTSPASTLSSPPRRISSAAAAHQSSVNAFRGHVGSEIPLFKATNPSHPSHCAYCKVRD